MSNSKFLEMLSVSGGSQPSALRNSGGRRSLGIMWMSLCGVLAFGISVCRASPHADLGSLDPHPVADLFGPLRAGVPRGPDEQAAAEALAHLRTVEGAHLDSATGQLLIFGEYTEAPGPIRMEDVGLGLRSAVLELEPLSMTIDPMVADKNGPLMDVRFFGESTNTHFGQVMFECDRLMKGLGLGQDNLTRQPLTTQAKEFVSYIDLCQGLSEGSKEPLWARFWIVQNHGKFPEDDSRGKPVVQLSDDRHTAWFHFHRLYAQTEMMKDPGKGRKLESSGGQQNPAAKRFVDHFNAYYDDIAKEFPAFADLKEMSKLVSLGHWAVDSKLDLDWELLYTVGSDTAVTTPLTTPSLRVTNSVRVGQTIHQVTVFGGVDLDVKNVYPDTDPSKNPGIDPDKTRDMAAAVERARSEMRSKALVDAGEKDGRRKVIVASGPRIRGPPGGEMWTPQVRGAIARITTGAGEVGLPAFVDPVSKALIPNLPVLRMGFSKQHEATAGFTVNGKKYLTRRPDFLFITSPLRDIDIRFSTKPEFDRERDELFFSSDNPSVKGFYPKSTSLVLKDGTQYRFDEVTGRVVEALRPGMDAVKLDFKGYSDGCFKESPHAPHAPSTGPPTGPLVRQAIARLSPTARTENRGDAMTVTMSCAAAQKPVSFRTAGGRLPDTKGGGQ